jgi:hypothetical protein
VPDPRRETYLRGVRLFDGGAFFEAHEAWEEGWRTETDVAARRTLQGLIQIAAGFHKVLVKRDPVSGARLFARGLAKLEGDAELEAFCDGVRAFASAVAAGERHARAVPRLGALVD